MSETMDAKKKIEHLEARLESLLRISQYPDNNIQQLLDFALEEAIALTRSKIGYIYFYDEERKEFTLNTWSKGVMQQCSVPNPNNIYQLENTGIWGEAVRQRRPVLVNDFAAPNPYKKGMPEGHAPLYKFLTIPVIINSRIVAVVGVANKTDNYNNQDIIQLSLIMDAVWKIVQRRQDEEKLYRANRLYSVISQVNQAIARNRDQNKLFDEICRIAIEYGKFRMAWIGLADNEIGAIKPVAVNGLEEGYLLSIPQISAIDQPEGRGPVGTTFRENRYFVCNHIATDPRMALWKEEALKRGYQSVISLPIKRYDQPIGALVIYSGQPDFFNNEEIKLLEEVAYDINYAIDAIKTEKELQESERKFYEIFNSTSDAIFIQDPLSGEVLDCNNAALQLYGFTKEEMANARMNDFIVFDNNHTPAMAMEKFAMAGNPGGVTFEWKGLRKDKKEIWTEISLSKTLIDNKERVIAVVRNIDERKKLLETIRESEERHRLMFETAQEAIAVTQDLKFVYFNPMLKNLSGYTAQELSEMDFIQIIHPDERELIFENYQRRMNGDNIEQGYTIRILRKDGSTRWVTISGTRLMWKGRPSVYNFINDITEQKASQLKLETSNTLLTAILESSPEVIVFALDKNYCYLTYNRKHKETMSHIWGKEIAPGDNMLEAIGNHPDREKAKLNFDRALAGESFIIVEEYGDELLSRLFYQDIYSPIYSVSGEIIGLTCYVLNITEQKQAEEALRETNEYLENLINHANAPIIVWDTGFRITRFNHAFENLTGFNENEMLGKSLEILFPGEKTEKSMLEIYKTLAGEHWETLEIEIQKRDQTVSTILWNSATILAHDGRTPIATIAQGQDITERKKTEEALRQSEAELRGLNATKDKFFSIISHDLRSPFSSIMGLAELMADNIDDLSTDQIQEFAGSIRKTAGATYRLLENLLEWSRLQRGLIPFNPQPINLKEEFSSCDGSTMEMAQKKQISLSINIPEGLQIIADQNMLHSIVRNLATNAIKFTGRGGTVSLNVQKNPTGEILFSIEDSGVGMNKEQIDKLFRIGTNVGKPGTEGEPSAGLGLILCREFVERHGGQIWAKSEPGKGSAFYFSIPEDN